MIVPKAKNWDQFIFYIESSIVEGKPPARIEYKNKLWDFNCIESSNTNLRICKEVARSRNREPLFALIRIYNSLTGSPMGRKFFIYWAIDSNCNNNVIFNQETT